MPIVRKRHKKQIVSLTPLSILANDCDTNSMIFLYSFLFNSYKIKGSIKKSYNTINAMFFVTIIIFYIYRIVNLWIELTIFFLLIEFISQIQTKINSNRLSETWIETRLTKTNCTHTTQFFLDEKKNLFSGNWFFFRPK